MKIAIVTCVKNEGPFLLEWIAHNRVIGVTDFLFYSNDCTDGTDVLLDRLSDHGIVRHLPNPAQEGQKYQMTALKAASNENIIKDADWVFVTDVDEFLNISVGEGRIPDLIDACENPKAISVTMRMMANSGVETYEDDPIISQFNYTHEPDTWGDQKAIEVKSLIRSDFPLAYYGAHRPFTKRQFDHKTEKLPWTDGSGRQVPFPFLTVANKRRRHRFPAAGARNFASLNHYTLRSLDSYLVKSDRGDVNRKYRNFALDYWADRNDGTVKENSIHKYLPDLNQEIDRLKALDGIADLHEKTVQAHREKIAELGENKDYQSLRQSLIDNSPDLREKLT